MQAARTEGVVVSYDLNFRPSLWQAVGGAERAVEVNRRLVALADVMFGNEEDLEAALGYEIEGAGSDYLSLDMQTYAEVLGRVSSDYPGLKLIATSLRRVTSASVNDWGGICFSSGRLFEGEFLRDLQVLDRVGGGDSFASGLDLRSAHRPGRRIVASLRDCSRGASDDDTGRHVDGDVVRGRATRVRARGADPEMTPIREGGQ